MACKIHPIPKKKNKFLECWKLIKTTCSFEQFLERCAAKSWKNELWINDMRYFRVIFLNSVSIFPNRNIVSYGSSLKKLKVWENTK